MTVHIILTADEYEMAYDIGYQRCWDSYQAGHQHRFKSDHLSFMEIITHNARAVAAEIAVAKWLGIKNFEPTCNTFKEQADIPPDWEVKHSSNPNAQYMPIREKDRNSDRAIFVRGFPVMEIVGWLPVSYCKYEDYWNNDNGRGWYWRVPISELVDVTTKQPVMNGDCQ